VRIVKLQPPPDLPVGRARRRKIFKGYDVNDAVTQRLWGIPRVPDPYTTREGMTLVNPRDWS